jgi:hypothetical protein
MGARDDGRIEPRTTSAIAETSEDELIAVFPKVAETEEVDKTTVTRASNEALTCVLLRSRLSCPTTLCIDATTMCTTGVVGEQKEMLLSE